jgi:hypothetical protein
MPPFLKHFAESGKMSDLGYVEGKNLVIESRYAEGQIDRLPALDRFGCSRKPGTKAETKPSRRGGARAVLRQTLPKPPQFPRLPKIVARAKPRGRRKSAR